MLGTIIAAAGAAAVAGAVGVAVGAALESDSNDRERQRRETNRNNQRSQEMNRNTRQVNELNQKVQNISQDNEEFKEALRRREKAEKKFREEMKKREEERKKERQRIEEQLQENQAEQKRLKKEIRKKKKKKDERNKREAKRMKEKLQQLRNEKKEKEKEKKQKEEKRELAQEELANAKQEINKYKQLFKELIAKDDVATINDELENLEKYTIMLKDFYAEGNLDRVVFIKTIEVIINIYEDLGDMFYEQGLAQQAVQMYEKVIDLKVNGGYNTRFKFKYGRALYEVGRYNDALQQLDDFDVTEIRKKNERRAVEYELDKLYFNIYLSLGETVKIEKYVDKLVSKYIEDKVKLKSVLDLLEKYIKYAHAEEEMITYFSLLSRYKKRSNLIDKLNDAVYDDFEYKSFYQGLQYYRDNQLKQAVKKFAEYKENDFAKIYYYRAKFLQEGLAEEELAAVDHLLQKLEKLLDGDKVEQREDFYEQNQRIVYVDCANTNHYFRLYLKLALTKLDYLFTNGNYDEFFAVLKRINDNYFQLDFTVSNNCKRKLAQYYNFFNKQSSSEKADYIYQILKTHSTKIELEGYLNQDHDFNKQITDIYEISDQQVEFIESPFYRGYYVTNQASNKQHIMVETYVENLKLSQVEAKQEAINRERILGEEYDKFANIYQYSIEDGITRIIYSDFKNSLQRYMEQNPEFSTETIEKKKKLALDLIEIFTVLSKEEIILGSLHPDRLMIDQDDNLILRDTFFHKTFKSESSSSIQSEKTFKTNKYKVADKRKDRDDKSNYYLLALLLYELFYGEYIFAGVKDYMTIRHLHTNRKVNKKHAASLKERWIKTDDSTNVRVDKVKIKTEDNNIPVELQKMLQQLLHANKAKRPADLDKLRQVITDLKDKEIKVDISKPISQQELIKFIAVQTEPVVQLEDEQLINLLQNNVEEVEIDSSGADNYYLKVMTDEQTYGVNKLALRYKVEEVKDQGKAQQNLKQQTAKPERKTIKIADLIEKTEQLLAVKDEEGDFLYQLEKILYDIEADRGFLENLDQYFLEELTAVINKLGLKSEVQALSNQVVNKNCTQQQFLELTAVVLEEME